MEYSRFFKISSLTLLLLSLSASSYAQDAGGYPRAMQGPMLGPVSENAFVVWVRGSWTFPVQIAYSENSDFRGEQMTDPVSPTKDNDYCAAITVSGLKPNTTYYYRVLFDGKEDKYRGGKPAFSVRTAPDKKSANKFRIAFGSCARFQRAPRQRIWPIIEEFDPSVFFWLGDNVYADTLDPDVLAEELARQREVPTIQSFLANVPQLAIWDDHDFGLNNHDRRNPTKSGNLKVWKKYWPNPSFGTQDAEGVFFKYQFGGVDFFFLDGRYYRSPNAAADGPEKTMLGEVQLQWLKDGLSHSDAPFKVLVSGSVWTTDKGQGGDAWSSYRHERNALFDWIMKEKISGVVLISGDTHTGELNAAPWSSKGGYDLYDLVSSPLAQEPDNDWLFRDVEQRIRLPYNAGENFGLIEFDLGLEDPQLEFKLIGLESKPVWQPLTLKASELQPGVCTWKAKQSDDALRWMKYLEATRP
ncbi:MAG: alkaline phosphatase D family protein [Aureliella sp.]